MMTDERELVKCKERLAELEAVARRALPGVTSEQMKWLLSQLIRQKIQTPNAISPVMLDIWRSRYIRIPVSVREFITGKEYLNLPIGEDGIFPKLVEGLEQLFAGPYSEVVLGGGIGYGKGTFGTVAVAYELYKVSCMRDPAKTFGLKPNSNLTFVNVSAFKEQAKKGFFTDLYNLLKSSRYFTREFPFERGLESEIRFPNNVHCYPVAASEQAALGMGVFCAFIDEANFMQVVERSKRSTPGSTHLFDQAEAVFNKLGERMRSRFNLYGKLPGHLYASSSARYPNDFTERLARRAREEAEQGLYHTLVLNYATWETKPEGTISKETFRVEVGDLTRNSRILTGEETDVVEANVIHVPADYRLPFERDVERAVQNLAGRSVHSIRPFISQREKIRRMFELGEGAGLQHPFTRLTVTLQDKDPALERLLPERLHWVEWTPDRCEQPTREVNGKKLMLFPALYHAHVDLSKSGDATGLVIAHNVGARKIPRFDANTMKEVEERKPIIRVDLVLRIVPPGKGEEIDIPRIRAILYQLNRVYKMQFGKITFDTYGSQESVKTMKDEGFNADILSVDQDTTPYEILRTAVYDQRVVAYHHPTLERELIQLERGPKKVDHPPHGSKDLADCLAAVIVHCEENWRAGESSRGLFQIGLVEYQGEASPGRQKSREDIHAKSIAGQTLTDSEEDLLFDGLELL